MRRRRKHDDTESALANFALTFAKAMMVFCVVLFVMISPDQKKEDGIKPKIEYMLAMSWPGDLDYDVDIWIKDPEGNILYYGNREVGFLNLERDDLGSRNNTITVEGKRVTVMNNEEIVAIRGFMPGEYIVNVHLYTARNSAKYEAPVDPFPVSLRIERLNPTVKRVGSFSTILSHVGQEAHLLRFTLKSDGSMVNINNELPTLVRPGAK